MSAGLLDFFVLESSECVERIDFLLTRAGTAAPDFEACARNVRELRGSATMAKVTGIAEIANVLERIVRGLRDGSLTWSDALREAITAAVDDLKVLIHAVRKWGPTENARAAARARDLNTLAPAFRRRSSLTPITASGNARFLADETASVAAGLQRFADNPGQLTLLAETLARVRALRGVAALSDLPPLAEVIAAVDDAGKPIELGTGVPSEPQRELFRSAAAVLREGSDAVHNGGRPNVDSAAVQAFTAAAAKFIEGAVDSDYVVPVSSLFPEDTGVNALHAAPNPPTTPGQRFRLEVVSHAEHLRRLVSDARRAVDPPSRQRLGHELRSSVRSLWRAAESFGEDAVARTLHSLIEGSAKLDPTTLTALDEAAAILTAPAQALIAERFASLPTPARSATPLATPAVARALATPLAEPLADAARTVTPIATTPVAPTPIASTPIATTPVASTPIAATRIASTPIAAPRIASTPIAAPRTVTPRAATAAREAPRVQTPAPIVSAPLGAAASGAALHDLLGAGLAGLAGLDDETMSEPRDVEDESVVPIEELLYRGRSALRRAITLGDAFKRATMPATPESLAELYDLLELAASE